MGGEIRGRAFVGVRGPVVATGARWHSEKKEARDEGRGLGDRSMTRAARVAAAGSGSRGDQADAWAAKGGLVVRDRLI